MSRCLGDCLPLAMFDFGDCWYGARDIERDIDRENSEEWSLLCIDCDGCLFTSHDCRGGVKGEEWLEVAPLVVLARGDGVKGMRPPAVFVENKP